MAENTTNYDDMMRWLAIQEQANELQLKHPDWRRGQALFNALHGVFPELANAVRGTLADPFHHDDRDYVQRFAAVVMEGHIHVPVGFGCVCGWQPTPPDSATYATQRKAHVDLAAPVPHPAAADPSDGGGGRGHGAPAPACTTEGD